MAIHVRGIFCSYICLDYKPLTSHFRTIINGVIIGTVRICRSSRLTTSPCRCQRCLERLMTASPTSVWLKQQLSTPEEIQTTTPLSPHLI